MQKQGTTKDESTVRIVIKVKPATADKIRKIPAKKRSRFIEEAVLKKISDEQRKYAFQHMMMVRDRLKVATTSKEIVEWLRKDRRSH